MTNNIFFNNDTLVLSLPLIVLCSTYAFFKFIPLEIGLPLIGFTILAYQINEKLRQRRAEQSLNKVLDESIVQELEEKEGKVPRKKKAASKKGKKDRKTNGQIRQRADADKKLDQNGNSSSTNAASAAADDDDWDEDDAMLMFAKGKKGAKGRKGR